MNVQLRKRHRRVWLGLFIPFAFVLSAGLWSVPDNPIEDIPINYCPSGIAHCAVEHHEGYQSDGFGVHYTAFDSLIRITLDLGIPLKSAFTVLELSTTKDEIGEPNLLGRIDEMGLYSFDIPTKMIDQNKFIKVRDHLKNETLFVEPLNVNFE